VSQPLQEKDSMKTILITFLLVISLRLFSQEVVATAGSTLSNSSGSISYTIGEGIANTLTKGDKTLTQGFQQTNLTVSMVSELKNLDFSISAFPNPTEDFLTLKLTKEDITGLQYLIYDMNGKLLFKKNIESNETKIIVDQLSRGIYILKVQSGLQELKAFKIIKQ